MDERLLQFIWQYQYFNTHDLITSEGDPLVIEHPGSLNKGQGPDFTFASIRIRQTRLIGAVELHVHASDWYRHGHHLDQHYNKVILHVVLFNDLASSIPFVHSLVLDTRIRQDMVSQYRQWMEDKNKIPCAGQLAAVGSLNRLAWLERLGVERLEEKAKRLLTQRNRLEGTWEEILWRQLAKSFGGKINASAFMEMAERLPLRILKRHRHQIHQTEALIFGQAGLLERTFSEHYPIMLHREYRYLQKRYSLRPSPYPVLFHPVRPDSFPTIRLAQLAMLMHTERHLLDKIEMEQDPQVVRSFFQITANDYWNTHYKLDEASAFRLKRTGTVFRDHILINVLAPTLLGIGLERAKDCYTENVLNWLRWLPPENNEIVRLYRQAGLLAESALQSQGLIQAYDGYCMPKKCLECSIGVRILKG